VGRTTCVLLLTSIQRLRWTKRTVGSIWILTDRALISAQDKRLDPPFFPNEQGFMPFAVAVIPEACPPLDPLLRAKGRWSLATNSLRRYITFLGLKISILNPSSEIGL